MHTCTEKKHYKFFCLVRLQKYAIGFHYDINPSGRGRFPNFWAEMNRQLFDIGPVGHKRLSQPERQAWRLAENVHSRSTWKKWQIWKGVRESATSMENDH